jgi:hypothetical protein
MSDPSAAGKVDDKKFLKSCMVIAVLCAVVAGIVRFASLRDIEPFVDHMNFMSWVVGVQDGLSHLLSERFLLRDFIYELLAPIYNAPYYIYNISSLVGFVAVPSLGFDPYQAANLRSIIFAALGALSWGFAAYRIALKNLSYVQAAFAGVVVVAALSVSDFWFHFSVQGWHNFAVFAIGLMVGLYSGTTSSKQRWIGLINAVFSYFIMPWIVWLALVVRDQFDKEIPPSLRTFKRRVLESLLIISPGVIVMVAISDNATKKAAQIEFSLSTVFERFTLWFSHTAAMLGWPMTIGMLVGTLFLALKREVFFLIFVGCHFVLSVVSARFGGEAWIRTVFYIVPVAVVVVTLCCFQIRATGRWLFAICLAVFGFRSIYHIVKKEAFYEAVPGYQETYEREPGVLKYVVREYAAMEDTCILPEDYYIFQAIKVWCPDCKRTLRPRKILAMNAESRSIAYYAQRHPLPFGCDDRRLVWISASRDEALFSSYADVWLSVLYETNATGLWTLGQSMIFLSSLTATEVNFPRD